MQAWYNSGVGDAMTWDSRGEIASGVGAAGDRVRFDDLDGDGRDDYLVVGANGRVTAWINGALRQRRPVGAQGADRRQRSATRAGALRGSQR
ncbi:hypothetical protein [Dactylosporangium sp. NPDC000521]|uniref:hypothetical protein n=1 Tax=Dactylosporangium sp. NPDC000521 TaxID=3363975 RepID=UPI0036B1015C